MAPVAGSRSRLHRQRRSGGRARFVVSRFRHQERRGEARYDAEWFAAHGYEVLEIRAEPEICFEGAGDALPFGRSLLAGYRFRSDFKAHSLLAELLSIPVLSVELVERRFSPPRSDVLSARQPPGHREPPRLGPLRPHRGRAAGARATGARARRGPVVLRQFGGDRPEHGDAGLPPGSGAFLESWGFNVCVSPVTEFMKAGGGVRCLTLALDVASSPFILLTAISRSTPGVFCRYLE